MAKVERLRVLLRESQYDERLEDGDSDEDEGMEVCDQPQRKVRSQHVKTSVLKATATEILYYGRDSAIDTSQ